MLGEGLDLAEKATSDQGEGIKEDSDAEDRTLYWAHRGKAGDTSDTNQIVEDKDLMCKRIMITASGGCAEESDQTRKGKELGSGEDSGRALLL